MLRFTKMHGLGNDYIYLDAVRQPEIARRTDLPELSRSMSDRHRGIGSDGLIVIATTTGESGIDPRTGVRMIMFNADGSRGEMCGNGIRCVCKYAVDHGLVHRETQPLLAETDAGVLSLEYDVDDAGKVSQVTVDMGAPQFDLEAIGVNADFVEAGSVEGRHMLFMPASSDPIVNEAIIIGMGNPHIIVFCESDASLHAIKLDELGPIIEHHPAFPNRINTHFVHVVSRKEISMRTWERGSGATQACGTGASAVCVAGVVGGLTDRQGTLIHLPGGDLQLEWRENDEQTGHVFMTGPTVEVFSGEWPG